MTFGPMFLNSMQTAAQRNKTHFCLHRMMNIERHAKPTFVDAIPR
jgi:hypothetical protein